VDDSGGCIQAFFVEVRRNLKDFKFAPKLSPEERKTVERVLSKALTASGAFEGDYLPLHGSQSFGSMPGGMATALQDELLTKHLAFTEPRSPAALSAGLGLDWPNGRGVYLSKSKDTAAWINEEDHFRMRVFTADTDLKKVFGKAFAKLAKIEEALLKEGHSFAHDHILGSLTVDPANIGCALRCCVVISLPRLSTRLELEGVCKAMHLSVQWKNGMWEIATTSSLGATEVDIANELLEGTAQLVSLEQAAARGESIDKLMRNLLERTGH